MADNKMSTMRSLPPPRNSAQDRETAAFWTFQQLKSLDDEKDQMIEVCLDAVSDLRTPAARSIYTATLWFLFPIMTSIVHLCLYKNSSSNIAVANVRLLERIYSI
jgi:hypothetical protein